MLKTLLMTIVCCLFFTSTTEARSTYNAPMAWSNPWVYNPAVNHTVSVANQRHPKVKRRHVVHRKRFRHHVSGSAIIRNPVGPVTEVETAAGITIKVAKSLAEKFQGFIKDIVEGGYAPKQIHCFASGGHVQYSRHYVGAACDFDQRGWGLTAPFMYHVSALAHKWGLRDGCVFKDCGHIDDGMIPSRVASKHWPLTYKENNKGG